MMWPFVLQFSSSPLDFGLLPFWWVPSLVRSILVTLRQIYFLQCSSCGKVDFVDLETRFCLLPFWWVPSLVRSISVTLRQIYFLQCSSYGEVDFVDLETRFCFLLVTFLWCSRFCWLRGSNLFFAVRFILAGSIALTLRHEFDFYSALTSIGSIALTLRHEFDFYSALTSIGSISLTLRHEIIFCSGSLLWHSDSGLFGNFGRR